MSGKAVRETLAALGVIASLVFVGTEIRQNTVAAQSSQVQAVTQQSMDVLALLADNDSLRVAYFLASADSALSTDQLQRVDLLYNVMMRLQMNRFYQDQLGIIDESILQGLGGRGRAYFVPYFRDFWTRYRDQFPEDFAAYMEAEYDLAP